ncbi:MAG TPA: hypothetical protein VL866_24110 [Pyrinomonadaceae bacterium]|nr:hypothetical protein [Pyrinomonadaceae bacterium]
MRELIFRPIPEDDGSYLEEPEYDVLLDGESLTKIRSDDMDLRSGSLDPLWQKLGLKVTFEEADDWD